MYMSKNFKLDQMESLAGQWCVIIVSIFLKLTLISPPATVCCCPSLKKFFHGKLQQTQAKDNLYSRC